MGGKYFLVLHQDWWFNLTFPDRGPFCLLLQVPTYSFPRFIQLLQFSCYSKSVLSGLVISIGGLQDSLRKASIIALLEYLQSPGTEHTEGSSREYNLCNDILWVLQQYKRCDRVIIPTLKVPSLQISYNHGPLFSLCPFLK